MAELETGQVKRRANPFNRFHAADVVRAVKAAHAAGLTIVSTEITTDGTIRLIHGAAEAVAPKDPFDKWKAKRNARAS